jgi:hypothetical protein
VHGSKSTPPKEFGYNNIVDGGVDDVDDLEGGKQRKGDHEKDLQILKKSISQ